MQTQCPECGTILSFPHLMRCPRLASTRSVVIKRVYDKLRELGVYGTLKNCQRLIGPMEADVRVMGNQLTEAYPNCPMSVALAIENLDERAVLGTRGVINTDRISLLLSWGRKDKVEQYYDSFRKRSNPCHDFSLDPLFLRLMRVMSTANRYRSVRDLPGTHDIEQYIGSLAASNRLHELHSPDPDRAEIVGVFNLMFLKEYLAAVPHVLHHWDTSSWL